MPMISAVRTGGLMCLAGVGLFAAGAAIWTLPGDGGRPTACSKSSRFAILGGLLFSANYRPPANRPAA